MIGTLAWVAAKPSDTKDARNSEGMVAFAIGPDAFLASFFVETGAQRYPVHVYSGVTR